MKLLPIDIRSKSFKTSMLGGYKVAEVKEFLMKVSEQYVQVSTDNKALESRLQDAQMELDRVRQIEGALLGALKQAEEQRAEIIEQSKQEARIRIMEGEVAAEALVNTAKQRAQSMLHQVQSECETKMHRMQEEFSLLDTSYKEVESHVDKLISQMQSFVEETNEKIAHLATLKNRKAIAAKLSSAKDLLEAHETRERMEDAEKKIKRPYDIEAPKAPTAVPEAAKEQVTAEKKTTAATETGESKGVKPRNLHESLAKKQLGHLPEDDIDMSNFFDPIQGKS